MSYYMKRKIKLQFSGRYFVNIPLVLIKKLRWMKGDELEIVLENDKITINNLTSPHNN